MFIFISLDLFAATDEGVLSKLTITVPGVSFAQGECPDDYHYISYNSNSLNMHRKTEAGECMAASEEVMNECDDENTDIMCALICGNTSSISIPVSAVLTQGSCPNNYYDVGINTTTIQNISDDGLCPGGYAIFDLNPRCEDNVTDTMCVLFAGVLSSISITMGGRPTYTQNGCPDGYVNMDADSTTARRINSACDKGYQTFTLNQQCDENTTDGYCVELCHDNLVYSNGTGQCGTYCDLGYTTFHVGDSEHNLLTLPVWKEKQITPSINIGTPENRCYINVLPGRKAGTVNLDYNGLIYHLTD